MHIGKNEYDTKNLQGAIGELLASLMIFQELQAFQYSARTEAELGQCYLFLYSKTSDANYRGAARENLSKAARFFQSIKSDWEYAQVKKLLDTVG